MLQAGDKVKHKHSGIEGTVASQIGVIVTIIVTDAKLYQYLLGKAQTFWYSDLILL